MSHDGITADRTNLENGSTRRRAGKYYVYVVQLKRTVLQKRKFARANPQYVAGRPCVYVGKTGHTPEVRFENHMRGHRASRYVNRFGKRLRQDVGEGPMSRGKAERRERKLAAELRAKGWAVWQR